MRQVTIAFAVGLSLVVGAAISTASNGRMVRTAAGDHFDLLELNHFCDPITGELACTQLIFLDWDAEYRRHNAHGFALIEDEHNYPQKKADGKWYWRAKPSRTVDMDLRAWIVTGDSFRETWTTEDPERKNKKLFDEKHRRRLHGYR